MAKKLSRLLTKNSARLLNLVILLAFILAGIILYPALRDFLQRHIQDWQWQQLHSSDQSSSSEVQVDLHIDSEEIVSLTAVNQIETDVVKPLLRRQLDQISQNQALLQKIATLLNARTDGQLLSLDQNANSQPSSNVSDNSSTFPTIALADSSLPEGIWLINDKIGLKARVDTSGDLELGLEKGVVLVPELGKIGQTSVPVVMAAHRYGYLRWWDSDYGRQNSFYYLPKLTLGDVVEIIQDQRRWYYEIYSSSEGTEITDYDADLILYTCEALTGDNRYFRYARLIDPAEYPEAFGVEVEEV